MRIMQGTFSHLPDLTDEEIELQIKYALNQGWAVGIEYTDDPHPRNFLWEMWGLPMFDEHDPKVMLSEINSCRTTYPNHYIRVTAYDASYGRQTMGLAFLVHRPAEEPGFRMVRTELNDRRIAYTLQPYATQDHPEGERYSRNGGGPA